MLKHAPDIEAVNWLQKNLPFQYYAEHANYEKNSWMVIKNYILLPYHPTNNFKYAIL